MMSTKSPFKKNAKSRAQESSNSMAMPEYIADSNILKSSKTYGKKKNYSNVSTIESVTSVSTSVTEQLKNNLSLLFSKCNEENNLESVIGVASSYSKNIIQEGSVVNSEISLFNDEDTDYYFSISYDNPRDGGSIPETSSSSSNYQRTRKNLKNQLSNKQCGSEEISESTSCEKNLISDLEPSSSSIQCKALGSINIQTELIENGVKTIDASVNKLPQNSLFEMANQVGKVSGKGAMLPNPSKNSSNAFSILALVNRFAASSNQASGKDNHCNKRKRTEKECVKTSVVECSVVNSIENKISNSEISIKNYSKSSLKSDVSIASNQGALKKSKVRAPSKANQKGKGSVDNVEESSINNRSEQKKVGVKTLTKGVRKGNKSVDNTKRSIQMLQKYVSKNQISPEKTIITKHASSPSNLVTSNLHLVRNETPGKVQLNNGDQEVVNSSFVQPKEIRVQSQTRDFIAKENVSLNFDLRMPMIIAPNPPTSQMAPLYIWGTDLSIKNESIQSANNDISYKNSKDVSIPGPSSLNDYSSVHPSDHVENLHANKKICLINKNTTTTTTINRNNHLLDQRRHIFKPRSHINDGVEFHQFMANGFKRLEDDCILKCREQVNKIFSMNPSLRNITVKEFCDIPALTDVLLDYLNGLDLDKSLTALDSNRGYDFPENFESEHLLGLIKDFVQTAITYIIPENASKPSDISYSRIIKAAMLKMSSREFVVLMQVFKKTDHLFKLKDVMARLSLVALFVIFDEYKKKKNSR